MSVLKTVDVESARWGGTTLIPSSPYCLHVAVQDLCGETRNRVGAPCTIHASSIRPEDFVTIDVLSSLVALVHKYRVHPHCTVLTQEVQNREDNDCCQKPLGGAFCMDQGTSFPFLFKIDRE